MDQQSQYSKATAYYKGEWHCTTKGCTASNKLSGSKAVINHRFRYHNVKKDSSKAKEILERCGEDCKYCPDKRGKYLVTCPNWDFTCPNWDFTCPNWDFMCPNWDFIYPNWDVIYPNWDVIYPNWDLSLDTCPNWDFIYPNWDSMYVTSVTYLLEYEINCDSCGKKVRTDRIETHRKGKYCKPSVPAYSEAPPRRNKVLL